VPGVTYRGWTTAALEAERARLQGDAAGHGDRARIGRINAEMSRRDAAEREQAAREAIGSRGDEDWLAGRWLEHAPRGHALKPNAVLSVLLKSFGGDKTLVMGFLGYTGKTWRNEIARRASHDARPGPVLDEIMRLEFRSWERGLAQHVANARQPDDRSDRTAAKRVAREMLTGWQNSLRDWKGRKPNVPAGTALLEPLTRAIDDVTRPWLARRSGIGPRSVPVIRQRQPNTALRQAIRDAIECPPPSDSAPSS
jgi:hypothetical protein